MKHIIHLQGQSFTYCGEIRCTHVVIGRRDIGSERVAEPEGRPGTPEYAEQYEKRLAFVRNETGGRYALKPLEWAVDEEEAEKLAAHFALEGHIDISIAPVSAVIENG